MIPPNGIFFKTNFISIDGLLEIAVESVLVGFEQLNKSIGYQAWRYRIAAFIYCLPAQLSRICRYHRPGVIDFCIVILSAVSQGPYKFFLPKHLQSHYALGPPISCLTMDYTTRNVAPLP